jgi:hypothetical protein
MKASLFEESFEEKEWVLNRVAGQVPVADIDGRCIEQQTQHSSGGPRRHSNLLFVRHPPTWDLLLPFAPSAS